MKIRIGTRGSALAVKQAEIVAEEIQKKCGVSCEIVKFSTKGDRILDKPLLEFGGKGVFVTEIENAIANGEIDIAVHSGKDLPAGLSDGLEIIAVPPRGSAGDVFIKLKGTENVKTIGTGSLRRIQQGKEMFPNANFVSIRGNIQTRLSKLKDGTCDGVILAAAALERLNITDTEYCITHISTDSFIPAAAQGTIAVEGKPEGAVFEIVSQINHHETWLCFTAERHVLSLLSANCHSAAGVHAQIENGFMTMKGFCGKSGIKTVTEKAENFMRAAKKLAQAIQSENCVYIVGAGCGTWDLITVRGIELIKNCDTIIYDSLIDKSLLSHAKKDCRIIFVGKRGHSPHISQEQINSTLIDEAKKGGKIVRLKGGDPFVFGRGGEEALCLKKAGIPFEVVPGVTSSTAAALFAGIPVTHRGTSQSFTVVTGRTANGFDGENFKTLAALEGTLVFVMGVGNVRQIAKKLIENGKSPQTQCAVIMNGGFHNMKTVKAELCSIADETEKAKIGAPAVIVVGPVCSLDFSKTVKKPLDGVTVGVTGTSEFAKKLSSLLWQEGAKTYDACTMSVCETKNSSKLEKALANINEYSCIAFTSSNAVKTFFKTMRDSGKDIRSLGNITFAAIGAGTAATLREHGITADIVPEEYTSRCLGKIIGEKFSQNEKILIPRAANASPELTKQLKNYEEIEIYTLEHSKSVDVTKADFITFASAKGVETFFENQSLNGAKAIAIGPVTANALREKGVENMAVAENCTAESIVKKIILEAQT
ncbi:MAG: hydroxymethylbilane synthase [Firmicutes bacterium]|nr:hydroxymethylbilane synthase [Bacillota bacterium]